MNEIKFEKLFKAKGNCNNCGIIIEKMNWYSKAASSTATSGNSGSSESKRRDSIKSGLEDLQRALPQFGTPEEEKVKVNFSQVIVLWQKDQTQKCNFHLFLL